MVGALGASLGLMVISLTETEEAAEAEHLASAERRLSELQDRFTSLAERDEAAYQGYRDAASIPKSSPDDKAARRAAMQQALKNAASVPLETAEAAVELAGAIVPLQQYGNPYLLSDAQIAALCASTCFEAARVNVNVNLAMIKDDNWITGAAHRLEELATALQTHLTTS